MTNQLQIFSIIIISKYMYLPSWLVIGYNREANLIVTFSILSLYMYYVYEYSRRNNFHLVTIALHLVRVDTIE